MRTPAQDAIQERLRVFTALLEGYADTILERVAQKLVPSYAQIHEAMQRHRIERGEAGEFIESLLGLDLGRDDYALGNAFCAGVIERAGLDGLNRVWADEDLVPTTSELEAPGLWLARIDLPSDPDEDPGAS
jgi:putative hydrolase